MLSYVNYEIVMRFSASLSNLCRPFLLQWFSSEFNVKVRVNKSEQKVSQLVLLYKVYKSSVTGGSSDTGHSWMSSDMVKRGLTEGLAR